MSAHRQVSSVRQRTTEAVSNLRQQNIVEGRLVNHGVFGYASGRQDSITDTTSLAELTSKARKRLPTSTFAIPGKRAYPIPDESHARNALARVAQHGTPEEKAQVQAAVRRKFPNIGKSKKGGK